MHAELFTTVDDLGAFVTAVRAGRFVKPATLLRVWKPYRVKNVWTRTLVDGLRRWVSPRAVARSAVRFAFTWRSSACAGQRARMMRA